MRRHGAGKSISVLKLVYTTIHVIGKRVEQSAEENGAQGRAFRQEQPRYHNRDRDSCREIRSAVLLGGAGLVPVDNVDQVPVVLSELKLELAVFVDDQLRSRIQNARALRLVGIA